MITFILNWKSFGSLQIVEDFLLELSKINTSKKIILAFPILYSFLYKKYDEILKINNVKKRKIFFASQDISAFQEENRTGEITGKMLLDFNINYTLIGHFERRFYLKEEQNTFDKKISNAIKNNIIPIICFGEDFEKRITNEYKDYLINEINNILNVLKKNLISNENFFINLIKSGDRIIIGYEPIWCIGKNIIPSTEQINEIYDIIVKCCEDNNFPIEILDLCYGGSVNKDNIKILKDTKFKTFLIGNASRDLKELKKILE